MLCYMSLPFFQDFLENVISMDETIKKSPFIVAIKTEINGSLKLVESWNEPCRDISYRAAGCQVVRSHVVKQM